MFFISAEHAGTGLPALPFPSCTGGPYSVVTPIKPVIGSLKGNWEMIGSGTLKPTISFYSLEEHYDCH